MAVGLRTSTGQKVANPVSCTRSPAFSASTTTQAKALIVARVSLQTAWLSPPVALSAYFLKGVVPDWDLKDIYIGMLQFMVLQLFGVGLLIAFPQIALWLPSVLLD